MSDAQKKKEKTKSHKFDKLLRFPAVYIVYFKKRFLKQKYTSNVNGSVYTM